MISVGGESHFGERHGVHGIDGAQLHAQSGLVELDGFSEIAHHQSNVMKARGHSGAAGTQSALALSVPAVHDGRRSRILNWSSVFFCR